MKEPKAHVDYLKELNEEDYRRLINGRRYHDLLGVDPNSPFEAVKEQWKELRKHILKETILPARQLLSDIHNAFKKIEQQQPVSGQDKEYEEKGKKYIFNNPQRPISLIAFSCLSGEDQKTLAILIGEKIISPDIKDLPDGDKIKERQAERNKGITELIKAAGIRQQHLYAHGCNLIKPPHSPISLAEFELLPQEDKTFFAIYLDPYLKNRLNDVNRKRMLTLIDAAKNESYYKIGERFLPQMPGFNLLQDQDKRFLAILRGKKERKITLSTEEVERERLLEQRLQTERTQKEQTELIRKEQTEKRDIAAIKTAVLNDNQNACFEYAKHIDWFLRLPGKEKEHFEFLIKNNSRANNTISDQHLENYLDKDLSEEEFTERFELILVKAKGNVGAKVSSTPSYLERYLQESGSSPCDIERIKNVLNSSSMSMLEEKHWKRLGIQHYELLTKPRLNTIPVEAIGFISEPTARGLYDILQRRLGAKTIQNSGQSSQLRKTIIEIEKKIRVLPENSILKTSPSAAPQAAASHSFPSGTLNSPFLHFQLPRAPNSLADSSTASPPSKKQRTG